MKKLDIAFIAGPVAGLVLVGVLFGMLSTYGKNRDSLSEKHDQMATMKVEYDALSQKLRRIEGRRNISGVQGIAEAVDEIFGPIGLKDRVSSMKILPAEVEGEERAEAVIKSVDMNETVNFLYLLNNAPMMLSVKKVNMKTSFENPQLLDVTMTLSFVKPS